MNRRIQQGIGDFIRNLLEMMHRRRTVLISLSCVVVFLTTYLLILPAFTLDKEEATEQGGVSVPTVTEDTTEADIESDDEANAEPAGEAQKADTQEKNENTKKSESVTNESAKSDSGRTELASSSTDNLLYEGDSVKISIDDTQSVLPADASIKVEEIDKDKKEYAKQYKELYKDALAAVQEDKDGKQVADFSFAKFYDISILDGKATVEPEAAVDVRIEFDKELQKDLAAKDTDRVRIIHFTKDKETGEITPEILDKKDVVEVNTDKKDQLTDTTFKAEGFSVYAVVYTVDFHYEVNGKVYDFSMDGGGCISLKSLVETLKVDDSAEAFVANVEKVQFSDPELVWVGKADNDTTIAELKEANGLKPEYSADLTKERITKSDAQTVKAGDWVLISMKPFETEESLTVTMKNGDEFVVKVTDSQISGNVLTADGKTYKITVTYDDDAEIPDGTELVAKEIKPGSKEYIQHFCKAWSEVNKEYLEQEGYE